MNQEGREVVTVTVNPLDAEEKAIPDEVQVKDGNEVNDLQSEGRRGLMACMTCTKPECDGCQGTIGIEDVAALTGAITGTLARETLRLAMAWGEAFMREFRAER